MQGFKMEPQRQQEIVVFTHYYPRKHSFVTAGLLRMRLIKFLYFTDFLFLPRNKKPRKNRTTQQLLKGSAVIPLLFAMWLPKNQKETKNGAAQ
jgi:hypothetical protein